MKINLLKISGLSAAIILLNGPAFSMNSAREGAEGFLNTNRLWQQVQSQNVITGTVVDETNQPVPGVGVVNSNSGKGTVTDANGKFSIAANATDVLRFSYVGYQSQSITVGTQQQISIKLKVATDTKLNEVVVVGYGTQKRGEITSAVSTVKSEDFNQGGSRSPLDLIQGKVAGLSITRTGGNNPNASAAVQLRGIVSITGSATPLIVIDGIPGGNLDLLQQDDIESFDVLKDGSAAAIYGTRANAGVILITTKKGKGGDPTYDYNTYFSRDYVAKKPDFLTAEEFIARSPSNNLGANTDMYDLLLNKENITQYHNFAATGGTPKSNYRASLFYNDLQGISKENGRKNYGARLNLNQKGLKDRLSMQTNLAANFNNANLLGGSDGDFEQSVQRNPTAPVYNPDGSFTQTTAFNNYNPLARITQELNKRDQQTFSGDTKLTLEVIDGLKISAFGALIRDTYNDRSYRDRASYSSTQTYQGTGYASKANRQDKTYTFESTIDYNKVFNNDHSISAVVGYSYQYFTREDFNLNNSGFITDAFDDWNIGAGNAITNVTLPRPGIGSFKEDNTLISLLGRVNYAYQGKYLLSVSARREGSSRFGTNNKWGTFPAASVGWVITKESFMEQFKWVNNLKIRAGYGVTGNQGIPNYQSLITLSTGGPYLQDGKWVQTYGPSRNPNPDLRWEKKKEFNIGLEFGFLNNRLGGSIDYYTRKTTDLLLSYNAQVPAFVNSTIYTNVGSISNKGLEIAINAVPVQTKDFQWSTDVLFSTNKNNLSSLSNDVFKATFLEYGGLPSPGNLGNTIRAVEGQPLGNFYGRRFAGIDASGKWQFYKKDGSITNSAGINNEDLTVIGNGIPKYYASMSNTFKYKNLDLTIFFRGKFGYDILNVQDMFFGNIAWLPNNVLRSAIEKNAALKDSPQFSDYYLESGNFVKLDNITLGYNFKLKTSYIRNLRLYASGRNIATFTNYSGLDPELQDTGLTVGIDNRGFYPRTKTYTLGLQVGF